MNELFLGWLCSLATTSTHMWKGMCLCGGMLIEAAQHCTATSPLCGIAPAFPCYAALHLPSFPEGVVSLWTLHINTRCSRGAVMDVACWLIVLFCFHLQMQHAKKNKTIINMCHLVRQAFFHAQCAAWAFLVLHH